MLEQWQYEALRARAEREGRSLSDLIREIVSAALAATGKRSRLGEIEGIGEDATAYGQDHDEHLYGRKPRR